MSLIVNHLSHIYEEGTAMSVAAVKDVNLKIDDGEFIGLIGHTGSGKSTFIQHLNGLIKPTSGEVYFEGADISDKEFDKKNLRSKVGLIFQYPEHQLFETTVFEDVCFGPKNIGLSRKETELRAYEALKTVGIEDECFYRSPFDLSGGQKRRVAIAGVLAMKPSVLILDEPTAGLDPSGRVQLLNMIKDLHEKEGMTVILVSHSMEDVAEYAGRIIVMNKGEVAFDGKPKEVFSHREELIGMGLNVPVVSNVAGKLKEAGYDIDGLPITVKEGADMIERLYLKRK